MAEQEKNQDKDANLEQENLTVKDVVEESTNKPADETVRQVLRGDETKGNADERDIIGSSDSVDTPQGREEAKIETEGKS